MESIPADYVQTLHTRAGEPVQSVRAGRSTTSLEWKISTADERGAAADRRTINDAASRVSLRWRADSVLMESIPADYVQTLHTRAGEPVQSVRAGRSTTCCASYSPTRAFPRASVLQRRSRRTSIATLADLDRLRSGEWTGATGKRISTVVNIGHRWFGFGSGDGVPSVAPAIRRRGHFRALPCSNVDPAGPRSPRSPI